MNNSKLQLAIWMLASSIQNISSANTSTDVETQIEWMKLSLEGINEATEILKDQLPF